MLFKKIKFNTEQECVRQIRVLHYPVFEYYTKHNEKKKHYSLLPQLKNTAYYSSKVQTPLVFYLKINRNENWAFLNLQHWIDVINIMNGDFYIVCDNEKLKLDILNKIKFKNKNIKFIESDSKLRPLAKKLVHPRWVNAAVAHMTTFYHAKQRNLTHFWNIDADDTTFCIDEHMIAQMLDKVKEYADDKGINCFSLDMWRSRSLGVHWSFGITYTKMNTDYETLFNEFQFINWQKDYSFYNTDMNIDWFFNYLTQYRNLNTASFYFENSYFIHWGDFFVNCIGSSICYWENSKVRYPILLDICHFKDVGEIDIAKDCIKFDMNLSLQYGRDYLINNWFNFNTNIKK